MHRADNPPPARPGAPTPLEQVRELAHRALGPQTPDYRERTADARHGVPRESEITLIPSMPGVEFNPDRRTFRWVQDVQQESFLFRAAAHLDGTMARGRLSAYLGVVLIADVDLAITIDSTASPETDDRPQTVSATAYRKIFASYSRRDAEIVRQFETFARALGDRYLIDQQDLRAGETWSPAILRLIDQADVFQLFWSTNVVNRPEQLRREWEHALLLGRPSFVRPTYWEDPFPESKDAGLPPESLRALQFERIGLLAAEPECAAPAAVPSPVPAPSAAAPLPMSAPPSAGRVRVDEQAAARIRAAYVDGALNRSRRLLDEGKHARALEACLEALAHDGNNPTALELERSIEALIEEREAARRWEEAARSLRRAEPRDEESPGPGDPRWAPRGPVGGYPAPASPPAYAPPRRGSLVGWSIVLVVLVVLLVLALVWLF
jgi:hypothetical protein